MNLNYVLKDEKGVVGQSIPVRQGETKTISVYLFNPDGTPYVASGILEAILKIFAGVPPTAPLVKKLSLSQVTLLSGLSGTIGFQFSLTAADTAALPVSSTIGMSVALQDAVANPTNVSEQDFLSALNVSAPLVS